MKISKEAPFKYLPEKFGSYIILDCFNTQQLKQIARKFDVPMGKNKLGLIENLTRHRARINLNIIVEIKDESEL
jgi:hypothetical protein